MIRRTFLATLLLSASLSHAAELAGRVVGLSDGDTITVLDALHVQHKIRLAGIDAPEKKRTRRMRCTFMSHLQVCGSTGFPPAGTVPTAGRIRARLADARRPWAS